jgi:hypothetical protein
MTFFCSCLQPIRMGLKKVSNVISSCVNHRGRFFCQNQRWFMNRFLPHCLLEDATTVAQLPWSGMPKWGSSSPTVSTSSLFFGSLGVIFRRWIEAWKFHVKVLIGSIASSSTSCELKDSF